MKRITLLFVALMALGYTGLQAQSCAGMKKSCATKTASVASCHGNNAAAQLAALDESIEVRKSEETGEVSYVRKEECPATGKVTFTSVNYSNELGKFVNVSPTAKACCDKDKATGCCSGKSADASASAVKTSLTEGKTAKGCCASGMKAQCSKKGSSKVAEVEQTKVKAIKVEKGS